MVDGVQGTVPLLDAASARAGDAAAVDAGDTWSALMHRAAGHLARGVVELAGHGYGLKVALIVGKGNNGGDGWAAAHRLEREHGAQAWVVAVAGLDTDASAEAADARRRWRVSGGRTSGGTADLDRVLAWCDVAVDCVLGTGITGQIRGDAEVATTALRRWHAAGTPVLACDIPSGVSADDGSAAQAAVRADRTVTFGALKRGLVLHPGAAHAGEVVVGGLGSGYDRFLTAQTGWQALTPAGAAPRRFGPATDKRERGVVLGVAGAVGTAGAAALCATGALRTGAGLVTLVTPEPVRAEVAALVDPGVLVRGGPAGEQGGFAADAQHAVADLAGVDAVLAGPGLGRGPAVQVLVEQLRRTAPRLVLDADALNVHRDDPAALADHVGALVLTPHEREFARIGGGSDGPDAFAHRVERAPELAARYDATIVVKGPGTLIAAPDGRVWVTPVGSPALGSGGTGDVLAGVVAAAIARADDVPLAVAQAVWWHAAAGQQAGAGRADRATATDVLAALPAVLGALTDPTNTYRSWPGAKRPAHASRRPFVEDQGRIR